MTLRVVGSAAGSATGRLLIDARESLNGIGSQVAIASIGSDNRGDVAQYASSGGSMVPIMLGTGGSAAIAYDAAAGLWLRNLPSAAARVVLTQMAGGGYKVPAYQRFSDPTSLPISLRGWPLCRYTFEIPVRSAVAGTAEIEIGLVTSNGMLNMLGVNQGMVWSSDPAVNGGAWRPKYRQTNGGAQTFGPDSGVIPTAASWNLMGIRYTEGPVPTLEWLLDTVPLFTISGDANMPVPSGVWGGTNANFGPGVGINTPAGRTLQTACGHFTVEEL